MSGSALFRINFVILILGEDVNYGFYATAPMYDIAFERGALRYPELFSRTTRRILYQKNVKDCASAGSDMLDVAGKMFDLVADQNGITILLSPGCSLEVMALADFAREMDVMLIGSTSADVVFMNKLRYPTFISFGPTGRGAEVPALKMFLEKYSLTTITVFCENLFNYLNVASFYGLTCRSIKSLIMTSQGFTVSYQDFDSVRKPDYTGMLLRAKRLSRVIVLETREDIVRRIMIAAYHLNMTRGEYVFLFPQPNRLPLYVDLLDKTNDPSDHLAEKAFESLIVLQFDYSDWSRSAQVFDAVARRAWTSYNYTYREDEKTNDDSLSAYEAVTSLFEALHDLTSGREFEQSANVTGRTLRNAILNKTFDLDTRHVSIGPDAYRLVNTIFLRLHRHTKESTPVWKYDALQRTIANTSSEFSGQWHGRAFPPPNIPTCGFMQDFCSDESNGKTNQTIAAAGGTVGGLIALVLIIWTVVSRRSKITDVRWWMLDQEPRWPSTSQFPDGNARIRKKMHMIQPRQNKPIFSESRVAL